MPKKAGFLPRCGLSLQVVTFSFKSSESLTSVSSFASSLSSKLFDVTFSCNSSISSNSSTLKFSSNSTKKHLRNLLPVIINSPFASCSSQYSLSFIPKTRAFSITCSSNSSNCILSSWLGYFLIASIKLLHNRKKSSKRSEFLRFYLYFCHVIQNFVCFYFATLR